MFSVRVVDSTIHRDIIVDYMFCICLEVQTNKYTLMNYACDNIPHIDQYQIIEKKVVKNETTNDAGYPKISAN
jgi:hypothetical protein